MVVCSGKLCEVPSFTLNGQPIDNVNEMEILGMVFNSAGTADDHVAKRIDKCRRSFYALNDVGMGYPGCSASIKSYLWKTMCQPVLLYGLECFNLPGRCLKDLETCQGNLVKQSLGFSKRSRTSFTLQAMNVFKVVDCF